MRVTLLVLLRVIHDTPKWKGLIAGESESDILAQFAVYKAAERMSKDEMFENGVFVKAFFQAKALCINNFHISVVAV